MRALLAAATVLALILPAAGCGSSAADREEFGTIVNEFPNPGSKPGDRFSLPLPEGVDEDCPLSNPPQEDSSQSAESGAAAEKTSDLSK
ncbi:MAG: hypothetical protein IJG83_01765 [Thermoguttaceae bacterium]|nr:hypothetical protein [Thermoguttaceae bacterium]MBQ2683714.1 hypothetical protein [Thermoguttaceae bacterium]MBQ3332126.1 hypothetical protein [Thermoguttaceae bacterium]MBQ6620371.1 hypothetical protein [Thermoguttaceae bacterium]MBR2586042.1 hypothetical protein [Thermoguttaceae bacterium]